MLLRKKMEKKHKFFARGKKWIQQIEWFGSSTHKREREKCEVLVIMVHVNMSLSRCFYCSEKKSPQLTFSSTTKMSIEMLVSHVPLDSIGNPENFSSNKITAEITRLQTLA